jgi:anti-anti-sigma factor
VREVSPVPLCDDPIGLAVGDHLCWTYSDSGDLDAAVVAFLTEGLERDEQLLLVGPGPIERLLASVDGLAGRDALVSSGRLEVRLAVEAYGACSALGAQAQVDQLRAATEDARRRGRTGLRIAADVTELGRDPGAARALQRYEQAVDALFDTEPVTAMCIYAEDLADAVLGPMSVLHPLQHRADAEAAVHVSVRPSVVRLVGELDLSDARHVTRVLDGLRDDGDDDVVVDLTNLAFLDVAGARALGQAVAAFAAVGRQLRVQGANRNASRCLSLFEVPAGAGGQ